MKTSTTHGARAPLSETTLLYAARRRDQRAEAQLLVRYDPLLRSIVWRCRRPAGLDAEDLAQEARVGFARAIARWRPEHGPFAAFARTTVRNHVLNVLDAAGANKQRVLTTARSVHDRRRFDGAIVDEQGSDERDLVFIDRRGDADPEAVVVARHELAALRDAMRLLTAWERRALRAAINGEPRRQVALDQGVTVRAVTLAIRRARRKLAAYIDTQVAA